MGLLVLLTACSGGGGGRSNPPPQNPTDTTPNAFVFTAQTDVAPSAAVASNEVTISGINAAAPVAITGGEYSIEGGAFTSAAGTVNNNQRVQVRVTSSAQFATAVTANLTIGGVSGAFSATTRNADTTPDAFQFQQVAGVAPNALTSSAAVTITGIEIPVAISIANGEYSIDGGAFTSAAGTIGNNQRVQVRVTSSSVLGTAVSGVLTAGGVSATFTAITRVGDATPDAFQLLPVFFVNPNIAVSSNTVTISGIEVPVSISITNGQYSIDGGAFTSAAGTVVNNQRVQVRVTSSTQYGTAVNAALTVGGVSDTFTATTRTADETPNGFQFPPMTGVPRNAWINSNTVTLTGYETAVRIFVENGEYSIAGGAYTSVDGTISPGQTLTVRVRSARTFSTTTMARVIVGGVSAFFEVTTTLPQNIPADVAYDGQDTIYLLYGSNQFVARWSISAADYLAPWDLGAHVGSTATTLAYSQAHNRLYIGYDSADIRYLDLSLATPTEVQFANIAPTGMAATAPSLVAAGNFLAAQVEDSPRTPHYLFDATGAVRDNERSIYYSRTLAFDAVSSRVYYFRDRLTPGDLHFDVIDAATGQISSSGDSPYHGQYSFEPPIRISNTGPYLLLGTGELYDRTTLNWSGSVGGPVMDGRWMDNGSLITLSDDAGNTVLRRLTGAQLNNVAEQRRYTGQALRVLGTDTRMAVLVVDGGAVSIHTYIPNDDTDLDGVPNAQDAFPTDPAASVDTDRDGYPDAMVAGVTSTLGLQVDAFPLDAACWLPAHGSGGVCNPAANIPAFIPDNVSQAGDTIYLLSIANRRVYRWSIAARTYINPYAVGLDTGSGIVAPTRMEYSASHQRLYLAYDNGAVRYIDVTSGSPAEHPYMDASAGVINLAAAGNHMLVQDAVGWGQGTRFIVNRDGVVTQTQAAYLDSREYAWDPTTSRLYFFTDHVSPKSLRYMVIDQATGIISSSGGWPYHGDYPIEPPLRVSPNGQQILLGTGDFYRPSDLTRVSTLGAAVTDARWMADGSLTTLTDSAGQTTVRRLASGTFALQEHVTFTGVPLRVVGSDAQLVVVTLANGAPQFHVYVPNDDIDGDGVSNALDAFPTDPAASVDTDRDGYPDALTGASTTGLQLDAFPQDAACWLAAHGSGGVCNYAATVPNYVPDQVLSDGDMVYLLSRTNRRVYRWSIATGQYLNPYVVGISEGATTTAPVRIAYSAAHQRLYVGYLNGVIRYIAPGSAAEAPFAMLSRGLDNLASVGNYLLAHDATGQWSTHYVYDAGGNVTGQRGFNVRPLEYTWDPVSSRVYYTRDSLYPNDLEYEVIDQTTGAMPTWGQSPYHGDFPIEPPVRVSADGSRLVIGTGYVQAREGLTLLGSLGKAIEDAHWKDHILVTVDANELVEIRDADTRAVLTSRQYVGQPLRLVFGLSEAYLVHVVGGTTAFQKLPFSDQDADQVPQWWEQLYGLSDANAADATADLDSDGVNNRNEYLGHSNPQVTDTDADGLTDFQELVTYATNPAHRDSDGDGLGDQAEVVTHHSNPNDVDSDDDGFDDFIEVLQGGNAGNAAVLPQPFGDFTESFEGTPNLAAWSTPPLSDTTWTVGTSLARTGSASLVPGAGILQNSRIQWRGYFARGGLTFHARVDRNSCCDEIEVFVDGNRTYRTSAIDDWEEGFASIEPGVHTIEFRYKRDDFGSPPEGAWIDDIVFNAY